MTEKGRWYACDEHLPTNPDAIYICYSEIHGIYHLGTFSPYRGWLDAGDQTRFNFISHWCDQELPLVYPLLRKFNHEAAEKYGIK